MSGHETMLVAIRSACNESHALRNLMLGDNAMNDVPPIKAHCVRITVLKKTFNAEFVEKYAYNPSKWAPCSRLEEGQEFVTSRDQPWVRPEGFCDWAWADIQKLVYGMARGGQETFVTCCTDGYRPVIFKLERIATGEPRRTV